MINFESNDGVNFVQDLLVGVLVQFVVVETDDNLGVVAIQCLVDGRVYLELEHLDRNLQLRILFKLFSELSL